MSHNQIVGSGFTFGDFTYGNVGGYGGNQRAIDIGLGNIVMTDYSVYDGNGAAAKLQMGGNSFSVLSI
ncbi:MAG: hypothetical protein ISR69_11675, partial [Gammaproteobacteria bacterium]|nr:hypothetical protein [Gammaproteobacteria bacterium]